MRKINLIKSNREIILFTLLGAILGYAILSPFTMVVSDLIHSRMLSKSMVHDMYLNPWTSLYKVFKPELFIWSFIFTAFSAINGYMVGIYLKTKRQYLDELNESYEKLKALENLRDSLTHMIIHDLNNPLMVLTGNLQLLEMELKDILSKNQQNQLQLSFKKSREIKDMIADLLDINKMEEDKFKLNRENISINDPINEAMNSMSFLAQQEKKKLIKNLNLNIPALSADKKIIKRVIANLIINALKFSPQGSEIEISSVYNEEKNSIIVSVKDLGQGIPKQHLERVFDKFAQVEEGQQQNKTGKGLGLTFCKMAIEAHGGKIWIESEYGKGSTFYFIIPIKTPEATVLLK